MLRERFGTSYSMGKRWPIDKESLMRNSRLDRAVHINANMHSVRKFFVCSKGTFKNRSSQQN